MSTRHAHSKPSSRPARIQAAVWPALLLFACGVAVADAPAAQQPAATPPQKLLIWPASTPDAIAGVESPDQESVASWHERFVRNVTRASMDFYPPEPGKANGGAVIVCSGGAFRFLSMDGGEQIARWLNARGIAAFMLRYRLKPTPRLGLFFYPEMLFVLPPLLSGRKIDEVKPLAAPAIADGVQAVRFVRSHAASWHLSPDRIGIAGFSAGGMVAIGASLTPEARDRPNFTAALYSGPLDLGPVPADAPPLFAAAAADDPLTPLATVPMAAAWKAGGAPVEVHIYQHGGHGFGIRKAGNDSDQWTDEFSAWLAARGV